MTIAHFCLAPRCARDRMEVFIPIFHHAQRVEKREVLES